MEVNPLFSSLIPPPSKLLFACNAIREGTEVAVSLYEKCLIESSPKKKQSIYFDFDLKFAFTHSPAQVTFERGEEKTTFDLKSEKDLEEWRAILRTKINQRGFH
jgi:hypothetical protein